MHAFSSLTSFIYILYIESTPSYYCPLVAVKEGFPFRSYEHFMDLIEAHGAPRSPTLYRTDDAVAEFISCLSDAQMEQTRNAIRDADYLAILTDESTDVSVDKVNTSFVYTIKGEWLPFVY